MDVYSVWIDSAMVYMKKECQRLFTKSLTVKLIPQFDEMATQILKIIYFIPP
jgi:hypothetical protein